MMIIIKIMIIIIIIIIIIVIIISEFFTAGVIFYSRLSDSESLQLSRNLLNIHTNLNSTAGTKRTKHLRMCPQKHDL